MGKLGFFGDATGQSDLRSCSEGILGVPFEVVKGNQALSRNKEEIGVLSSCSSNSRVLSATGFSFLISKTDTTIVSAIWVIVILNNIY